MLLPAYQERRQHVSHHCGQQKAIRAGYRHIDIGISRQWTNDGGTVRGGSAETGPGFNHLGCQVREDRLKPFQQPVPAYVRRMRLKACRVVFAAHVHHTVTPCHHVDIAPAYSTARHGAGWSDMQLLERIWTNRHGKTQPLRQSHTSPGTQGQHQGLTRDGDTVLEQHQ